jgi:hypothetical protein
VSSAGRPAGAPRRLGTQIGVAANDLRTRNSTMSGSDDSSLFANTKRFRAAVALFNGIDGAKLPLVLARILGGLGGAKGERVFSEAEEAQLRELLGLDEAALADLLGACAFVFEQAAYGPTAPERLRVELAGAGVEGAPADAFAAVWQEEGAAFVARLKERAVLAPQHLQAVDWQLCVRTADSCGGRAQQPHCVLQLDLRAPAPAAPADDGAGDAHVLMQLGVPELERLLHKLDAVQGQLDAVQGS